MRIGIDFDNTIACYDGVFYRAALEKNLIPETLDKSKNAVRDHLNGSGRKDDFTELQGYIYGARMDLVSPYPGFGDFVALARAAGHDLFVVSHKTKTPMMGPAYDMHQAARSFLQAQGLSGPDAVPMRNIFFELTKEDKIARAATLDVDVFIDDLPEILGMKGFPSGAKAVLFDPDGYHLKDTTYERHETWQSISHALVGNA